jgi:AbrB family looped-hinge helix DNA binding protein
MDPLIVEVGPKGRIVIPVAARQALGISEGSRLVVEVKGDALTLMSRDAIARRARARFADVDADLADELIRDRRHEAELANKGL